jgi:hypothetical protein
MNVLVIGPQVYTFSSTEIDVAGSGWPPRECFVGAVVVDLRPLGLDRARQAAIRLPLADPKLPAGHGRSPWRGIYRWTPGAECQVGTVAPDVFAILARSMGARVLRVV